MEIHGIQSKWYDKIWIIIILCIFLFPIGLYGLWKSRTIATGWKIAVTMIIAVVVVGQFGKDNEGSSSDSSSNSNSSEQIEVKEPEPTKVGIGQVLQTDYFDIVVNKITLSDRVVTGNEFADVKPEQGSMYLIMNVSFKNTDIESRMLVDDSVWIDYNGKTYEFDSAETIMLEGWGLLLDQINPLITKTTNLVYKIPAEINGPAYWQPGRANSSQRLYLGDF